ncbi:hypothetical protein [Aeromonas rivipollensis]|uniref:hypothetical protein n=1 Tax=Aeromonas rivipollensis TaxID=948519 RepID=UPI003D23AFB1
MLNNGCGCQKCGGKAPITEVEAIKKVQAICSMKGWRLLGFKDGWQNVKSQLMIECSCGRSWDPTYNRVVHNNGGNGCSACGNGGGYDPEIRGWFYTHLWTHPNGHQFLKYGITNYPTKRIKQQSRNTEYKPKQLCSIPFDDGSIPLAIERAIDQYKKANNILNQVSREDFRDGYTETLPLARLDFVANLIQDETTIQISRV